MSFLDFDDEEEEVEEGEVDLEGDVSLEDRIEGWVWGSVWRGVPSYLHNFTPSLLHTLTPSLAPSLLHHFTPSLL